MKKKKNDFKAQFSNIKRFYEKTLKKYYLNIEDGKGFKCASEQKINQGSTEAFFKYNHC